jgi:hypothetical protein
MESRLFRFSLFLCKTSTIPNFDRGIMRYCIDR